MQITVTRGAGDKPGPDIIDPLLTSEPVAVARGRREIDYHSSSRIKEQAQCPKHGFMSTGSLVLITEAEKQWPGLIRYFSLTLTIDDSGERFTADTGLHIERVR
jgi:hypothetical protein